MSSIFYKNVDDSLFSLLIAKGKIQKLHSRVFLVNKIWIMPTDMRDETLTFDPKGDLNIKTEEEIYKLKYDIIESTLITSNGTKYYAYYYDSFLILENVESHVFVYLYEKKKGIRRIEDKIDLMNYIAFIVLKNYKHDDLVQILKEWKGQKILNEAKRQIEINDNFDNPFRNGCYHPFLRIPFGGMNKKR